MLAKTLEGITIDYPIETIDIDEKQDLAIQYGVRGVPTLVMLQNDVETKRVVGVLTEGVLKDWLA
jgi:thioredoxin-like negative regulator of GroEL